MDFIKMESVLSDFGVKNALNEKQKSNIRYFELNGDIKSLIFPDLFKPETLSKSHKSSLNFEPNKLLHITEKINPKIGNKI